MHKLAVAALGLWASTLAIAQTPSAPDATSPATSPAPTPLRCKDGRNTSRNWAMTTQRFLENLSCGTAMALDGMLGDEPDPAAARRTSGNVDLAQAYSQFDGSSTRLRFSVRMALPNLQRRVSAFIGRDDDASFIRDRPDTASLDRQFNAFSGNDQFLAGLGYSLPTGNTVQSDVRVGVRSFLKPRVFVQARLLYAPYSSARDLLYTRLSPFWNSADGFGVTAAVDYTHTVSARSLLRLANAGTVSEATQGLDWGSSALWYYDLGGEQGLAGELFVRGQTDANEPLNEYGLRATYRAPLYKNVLYGRIVPGYSWPRTNPALKREGSYNILLGLQMPFGQAVQ